MKPQKFNQADTNLFNAKKNISNLVYLKFDISKIEIDIDSSIRHEYDPDKLQELAESIRANNNELIQPIVISNIRNSGNYRVVAGRRRFLACRDILMLQTISAIVKNYETETDEFKAQFAENEERVNWTDFDYVKAINKIKDRNQKITNQEIAEIFNKTIDWVKKKMQHLGAIQDLPDSAVAHLAQIPTSHAIELKKLPKDEKEKAIAELAELAKNNLPLTTVKSIRENISRNIPVTSRKDSTVLFEEEASKTKSVKKENRTDQTKDIYLHWKKTGYVDEVNKKHVIEFLNQKKVSLKSNLNIHQQKAKDLESEIKTIVSDSIALQEQQMFPVSEKKKKAGRK